MKGQVFTSAKSHLKQVVEPWEPCMGLTIVKCCLQSKGMIMIQLKVVTSTALKYFLGWGVGYVTT